MLRQTIAIALILAVCTLVKEKLESIDRKQPRF